MTLIKILTVTNLVGVVIGIPYIIYKNHIEDRRCKEIANLSRDELLKFALADPKLKNSFDTYIKVMDVDQATKFVTDNWLINNHLISYRKEES